MPDLNVPLKPQASGTAGEVPSAEDLAVAELALNTADGKLFTKHTDNSIVEITSGSSTATRALLGIGEYADDAAAGTGGVASGAMYYNTTSSDYRLKT